MREQDIEEQFRRIGQVIRNFWSLATYQSGFIYSGMKISQKERYLGWARGDLEWGMDDLKFTKKEKQQIRDFVDGRNNKYEKS